MHRTWRFTYIRFFCSIDRHRITFYLLFSCLFRFFSSSLLLLSLANVLSRLFCVCVCVIVLGIDKFILLSIDGHGNQLDPFSLTFPTISKTHVFGVTVCVREMQTMLHIPNGWLFATQFIKTSLAARWHEHCACDSYSSRELFFQFPYTKHYKPINFCQKLKLLFVAFFFLLVLLFLRYCI